MVLQHAEVPVPVDLVTRPLFPIPHGIVRVCRHKTLGGSPGYRRVTPPRWGTSYDLFGPPKRLSVSDSVQWVTGRQGG
jgi:hypothetical protein